MKKRILISLLVVVAIFMVGCTTASGLFTHTIQQTAEGVLTLPWEENAIQIAQDSGTLRFYFMSGEGQIMGAGGDTKYGDSCLIVFPNGEVMLIDAAMAAYAPTLVENLKLLGVTKIDHVVLSHMHNDHYGGLFAADGIFANFPVGTFYWNGTKNLKADVVQYFSASLDKYNPPTKILTRGDTFTIGEVELEVFNPPQEIVGESYGTIGLNNTSMSLKLTYKDFSALFSGDLYIEAEFDLISKFGPELDVDLVKINHHGRNTSNSKYWANATAARVAVATSGNMVDEIVYADYSRSGAHVYTDTLDGYIRFVSDGRGGEVTTSRARTTDKFAKWDEEAQKIHPLP